MAAQDQLDLFVREGLSAGRSRDDLAKALTEAGWPQRQVTHALARYAETPFTPPVPCPVPTTTPRHAFLYALLFLSMGFTASYLVSLVHGVIDAQLPDRADTPYSALYATGRIRWAIAILIVSTPVFIFLSRHVARRGGAGDAIRTSPVRKWLTYLALLASALVFFGDATYSIYTFLQGELTLRFVLKAATVAIVSGAVFIHYLRDVEANSDGDR